MNKTLSQKYRDLALSYGDRCVMCGMCSQACPTYQLEADENESPRGRIALIRGLLQNQLEPDPVIDQHLQHCLGCGSCETACPSAVPYSHLRLLSQAFQNREQPSRLQRLGLWLLTHKRSLKTLARLLRLLQQTGLDRMGRRVTRLGRLQNYLPSLAKIPRWRSHYPAKGPRKGQASLFTGCLSESLDPVTLKASIEVLTACGIDVSLPKQQTCCGALPRQAGDERLARQCQQQNSSVFSQQDTDAVIFTASGCGATLQDYRFWEATDSPDPRAIQATELHLAEICEFIAEQGRPEQLTLKPLTKRIFIHNPCTQRNALGKPTSAQQLLHHIPGIEICASPVPLPNCCGAGGGNMLSQPTIADALGEQTLQAILDSNPDIIVSSNIGCALQLGAQLRRKGLDIEVLHPIVLLYRQLGPS